MFCKTFTIDFTIVFKILLSKMMTSSHADFLHRTLFFFKRENVIVFNDKNLNKFRSIVKVLDKIFKIIQVV